LTSRSLTIPGGTSGGRGCSRSGRQTPQADLPFFDRDSVRLRQSYEAVGEIAKADFRPEFRGQSSETIGAAPRTDDDKGVMGETIPIVHDRHVRGLFYIRQAIIRRDVPPCEPRWPLSGGHEGRVVREGCSLRPTWMVPRLLVPPSLVAPGFTTLGKLRQCLFNFRESRRRSELRSDPLCLGQMLKRKGALVVDLV
jgi:hypothetical protein